MSDGSLAKIIESLSRPSVEAGTLSAKQIAAGRNDVSIYVAIDSGDALHLLIRSATPPSAHVTTRVQLRNVRCQVQEWLVPPLATAAYIDLACDADRNSPIRRPFVAFCEDIVREISIRREPVEDSIYRAYLRWRRFWALDPAGGVRMDWLRGLYAELLLLEHLVREVSPAAVAYWTGPSNADWDFQGSTVAVEVKSASVRPAVVTINTLRQLDNGPWARLYLCVFRLVLSGDGRTLAELVRRIEGLLESNEERSEEFWQKLALAGYRRELEPEYSRHGIEADEPELYVIDETFPKLIANNFCQPLDQRVQNVRYSVELMGLTAIGLADDAVMANLKTLCRGG